MEVSAVSQSLPVATLGTPRVGPHRELKTVLESFWAGKTDEKTLVETAARLRAENWARQKARGITVIPSNDFSFYDQVLDTSVMVGAIPEAYGWRGGEVSLKTYFAMARGSEGDAEMCEHGHAHHHHHGMPAQEMTKWFDTNYHYMVPEFSKGQTFTLSSTKPVDEFREARALGHHTRPVLVGPVTFLKIGKSKDASFDTLSLIDDLVPVYVEVLRKLATEGADWVQLDEPCLALDLDTAARDALVKAYSAIAREVPRIKIMLNTYFGALGDNLDVALSLPVAGLHLDLIRAPEQLDEVLQAVRADIVLSLGVIDGRNIWRADLPAILDRIEAVVAQRGKDRIEIAPSCSLLHVPIDLDAETGLDPDVKSWLAFSLQKMSELSTLGQALAGGRAGVKAELDASATASAARKASPKVHNHAVAERVAAITPDMSNRKSPFAVRAKAQRTKFKLPVFPTTTIGSFPQTSEVRKARAAHTKGTMNDADYNTFLREETERTIRWQEKIGLDVLVHGEFERNDMVQYFSEQLSGFAFTKNGWVQSYGSRCVRPPILFGDVSRPKPMT
ncbi:MAG: 5-methyltetrahydropteroyltriglutamate--homocysteine S-methyltransferase, partial [Xanthobacteraceae bacterium]|nr:5-methyltetrahydropteroyltriglutamate--homocysteine S-methyltransferase [Xanthobacteraceae bacterium]